MSHPQIFENQSLPAAWNATGRAYPSGRFIPRIIQDQAAATPEAIAVVFEEDRLTYRELDDRARALASVLGGLGIGAESLVGVYAERSLELVVGLLGILYAGGAYVPLDPSYPRARVEFMLSDSKPVVVLSQRRLADSIPPHAGITIFLDDDEIHEAVASTKEPVALLQDNLAYVIYTSGSTGKPKGVLCTHAGILNRLQWMQEEYALDASDRVLQKTPFSFDVSVWEFFWPLMYGACLVVARPGGHLDPDYLTDLIGRAGITTIHFVPSMLNVFLKAPGAADCRTLRRVICSGEALLRSTQDEFLKLLPHAELHNLYGPTEASVDVTYWACAPGCLPAEDSDESSRNVPIGRPIANIQAYVLDPNFTPLPAGKPGELFLAGIGLARGYLNRPELTAEKFVVSPFGPPGARMYRTGDLARWNAGGYLEFLGRIDHQVKIRGNRIELEEIETELSSHPDVDECIVIVREDFPGDPRIVAYMVFASHFQAGARDLHEFLASRLPSYMIPSDFVAMDALPVTPNGKRDRKNLPPPPRPAIEPSGIDPALGPTETTLSQIFSDILGVGRIGLHENFYDLGANSLHFVRAALQARARLGRSIPLVTLFERPTIASLTEALLAADTGEDKSPRDGSEAQGELMNEHAREASVRETEQEPFPDVEGVHRIFEIQAARTPAAAAAILNEEAFTYAELNARANRLARLLTDRGVMADVPVGICIERSLEMVVAVLAVLKAGGAYLPIHPSLPPARIASICADASLAHAVASRSAASVLPDGIGAIFFANEAQIGQGDTSDLGRPGRSSDLAYILYTSGSTGTPKGVAMEHGALINLLRWQHGVMPRPEARTLQFAALSFDVSFQEIFSTWACGGTLVLVSEEDRIDPVELWKLCRRHKVDRLFLPVVALKEFAEAAAFDLAAHGPLGLRDIVTAGEQLRITPGIERLLKVHPDCRLHNHYGPTETHVVTAFSLPADVGRWTKLPPIGAPIENCRVHVLDEARNPVSPGMPGELYIAGLPLARGYFAQPTLTAERFLPDPFASEPGARMYRTGDLVQWNSAGQLEYLGRLDQQVKVRGHRVELGEIETALIAHPGVRDCIAAACDDAQGVRQIVAYIVLKPDTRPENSDLRDYLRSSLPSYMLPAVFVRMDVLPTNRNGKRDRAALPLPDWNAAREGNHDPPRTDLERQLCEIWASSLNVARVGIHDDFFALGGHSISAAQAVMLIRSRLACLLTVGEFFQAPAVSAMAAYLQTRLNDIRVDEAVVAGELAADTLGAGAAPLSSSQQRFWFLYLRDPQSPLYNVSIVLNLRGDLNETALQATLDAIVARHEALRTVFRMQGAAPVQVVLPAATVPVERVDVTEPSWLEHAARAPFDLERGPILRALLGRVAPAEHDLLLSLPHIATDGWSEKILVEEFAALYRAFCGGADAGLPRLPVTFRDFAVRERRLAASGDMADHIAYWRRHLAGAPDCMALPTDRPRGGARTDAGEWVPIALSTSVGASLELIGQSEGATLFMVLMAALAALLARVTSSEDLVIGTPAACRTDAGIAGLIGCFINTLPLRIDAAGDPTFRELVSRVKHVSLNAIAHQDLPFDRLVAELQPSRRPGVLPLVQVLLALAVPEGRIDLPGLACSLRHVGTKTAKMDLMVDLRQSDDGIHGWIEYSVDLFDRGTVEGLRDRWIALLEAVAADPKRRISEIPLVTPAERRLLEEWNGAATEYPRHASVHRLFEEQAAISPDAVAAVFGDERLTYGELNARGNQLARVLRKHGVTRDSAVAVRMERCAEMIIAVLATLKAGGAYLPLNPQEPPERLAFMLEEARPRILLTQEHEVARHAVVTLPALCLDSDWDAIARESADNLAEDTSPHDLAYVMYTSGSTGVPKAVMVPHHGVVRLVRDTDYAAFSPDDVFLQLAPLAFDASTFEIWGALLNGATVAIAPPGPLSLAEIGEAIKSHGVTILWLTAGLFAAMVDERLDDLKGVRQLLAGGDVLPVAQARRLLERLPDCRLINGYGPTETTTFACCHTVSLRDCVSGTIPIGCPIANTAVYVLDPRGELVPAGTPGELYIGGPGVARGYLGRDELTAEKFVPNPFVSIAEGEREAWSRLYRTGDLVRWRADGVLDFVGRIDGQVKLRGYRIELGEIESVLAAHSGVAECVAVVREDEPGDRRIVAYVVCRDGTPAASEEILSWLRSKLPDYMIPAAIVNLPALPLTANGKRDRNALPRPDYAPPEAVAADGGTPAAMSENPLIRVLQRIWQEQLNVASVGEKDSFFELGGHSLLVMRMLARIEEATGRTVPVHVMYQNPTIAHIAAWLLKGSDEEWRPLLPIQAQGNKIPFFFVHGDIGGGGFYCREISKAMGTDQPFYALQPLGLNGDPLPDTIEQIASHYVATVLEARAVGPYRLGGFCNGGMIAYEMARQLQAAGHVVDTVIVVDASAQNYYFKPLRGLVYGAGRLLGWSAERRRDSFLGLRTTLVSRTRSAEPDRTEAAAGERNDTLSLYGMLMASYIPGKFAGEVHVLSPSEGQMTRDFDGTLGWGRVASKVSKSSVQGDHISCIVEYGYSLGERFASILESLCPP